MLRYDINKLDSFAKIWSEVALDRGQAWKKENEAFALQWDCGIQQAKIIQQREYEFMDYLYRT